MKGISSPILSPQFLTRSDFFVTISTLIDGEPVTTEVSVEITVSFDWFVAVDSVDGSVISLVGEDFEVFSTSSVVVVVENVVVGVVLRRVNRILFVLTTLSVPSESQAEGK